MKKFYLLLIAIFTINIANAQWQHTSLDSNFIQSIITKGDTIFAGSLKNGVLAAATALSLVSCRYPQPSSTISIVCRFAFFIYDTLYTKFYFFASNNILNRLENLSAIDRQIVAGIDYTRATLYWRATTY